MGSVGGHDPVERRFEQHVGDLVDHLVRHVGRDFEHDRPELVLPAPEVEQRVEYLKDMFARVRRAFAAGVVAADVDGEIVRILVEAAEEFEVVRRSVLGGGRGVLADVAAHDHAVVRAPQVADGGFQSAVRQTMRLMMALSFGRRKTAAAGCPPADGASRSPPRRIRIPARPVRGTPRRCGRILRPARWGWRNGCRTPRVRAPDAPRRSICATASGRPGISPMMRSNSSTAWWACSMVSREKYGLYDSPGYMVLN